MGSTGLRTSNHVQPSPIGPTLIAKTVMRMPFGKYLDIEVGQLPTDYLEWLDENVDLYGRLRQAVERELAEPANVLAKTGGGAATTGG